MAWHVEPAVNPRTPKAKPREADAYARGQIPDSGHCLHRTCGSPLSQQHLYDGLLFRYSGVSERHKR
ncbi:hypothetical protein JAAARDRAFT_35347 [Jaapia argillacea MUCL 33604]|uniref:Uncharacterized protein n=1 Tax=Jaapia argillacea MUCL 33604 TaxID=933084 RepID=A0A067Q2E2_9AGAM|nr:hypothetical protein JAAARDRAFT_35347 [Jaapia argillacea MUCL 33604]